MLRSDSISRFTAEEDSSLVEEVERPGLAAVKAAAVATFAATVVIATVACVVVLLLLEGFF
jgi:hypothetical protein